MGSTEVGALAYADDLTLFARTPEGMRVKLEAVELALARSGMVINPAKSLSLAILSNKKAKNVHLAAAELVCGAQPVRTLGVLDSFVLLGVSFDWKGILPFPHHKVVHDWLGELHSAPLKPQQRIELWRGYAMPRLLHSFVLGNVRHNTLRAIDVNVRNSIRKWLRLPKDCPVGFFHAAVSDGGLGLPSLVTLILLMRQKNINYNV